MQAVSDISYPVERAGCYSRGRPKAGEMSTQCRRTSKKTKCLGQDASVAPASSLLSSRASTSAYLQAACREEDCLAVGAPCILPTPRGRRDDLRQLPQAPAGLLLGQALVQLRGNVATVQPRGPHSCRSAVVPAAAQSHQHQHHLRGPHSHGWPTVGTPRGQSFCDSRKQQQRQKQHYSPLQSCFCGGRGSMMTEERTNGGCCCCALRPLLNGSSCMHGDVAWHVPMDVFSLWDHNAHDDRIPAHN